MRVGEGGLGTLTPHLRTHALAVGAVLAQPEKMVLFCSGVSSCASSLVTCWTGKQAQGCAGRTNWYYFNSRENVGTGVERVVNTVY